MSYRGKVILCGDAGVGKTSLLAQYVDDQFSDEYHQTIGANFLIKEIDLSRVIDKLDIYNPKLKKDIKEKGFKLYFWDLGGQKHALFANEYYFVQAVGALIIYDILRKETFDSIDFWVEKIKELSGDIPFMILGNKVDRKLERKVSYEKAMEKAEKYYVKYMETSAKLNENVDDAFEGLAVQILNTFK